MVRSPPRRRLTCPRVLTLTDVVVRVHLTTSAPFRVRAYARIRPVIQDGRRRPGYHVLVSRRLSATGIRFLVILCPPGNWAFLAVGLPVLLPGPDPDGVTTFRAHELRPGWVPSLPRGLRCPHGRQVIPGRRMPPCSGPSLYPRPATHHRRLLITRHHQGFTVVHPSGLPLACSPRVEREPSGFPPGLHTPPLPAAHAGMGTGIVGTCLSYVTISWPSSPRSHSPRATSCRTDLIRACVRHEALSFTDGGERPSISSPSWRWGEAGGSLIRGSPGRAGAASTKSRRFSTAGWAGRGEQDGKVYARNRLRYAS